MSDSDDNSAGAGLLIVLTVLVSGTLYFASFSQDCFFINSKNPHPVPPLVALIFGLMTVPGGTVAWLANPLLAGSWIMMAMREPRRAAPAVAGAGLAAALSFLLTVGDEIMTHEGGGVTQDVVRVGPGYWLWTASMVVTFAGSLAVLAASPEADAYERTRGVFVGDQFQTSAPKTHFGAEKTISHWLRKLTRKKTQPSEAAGIGDDPNPDDLAAQDDCFSDGSPLN